MTDDSSMAITPTISMTNSDATNILTLVDNSVGGATAFSYGTYSAMIKEKGSRMSSGTLANGECVGLLKSATRFWLYKVSHLTDGTFLETLH